MNPQSRFILGSLACALAFGIVVPSARANVFASNIKINGSMSNVTVAPGTNVVISYILNEPASAGVTVRVLSGATTVRSIIVTNGAGTVRGTNTVVWDGKADGGGIVPNGTYSFSITAASAGYAGWTLTTDDDNPGNYSWEPMGIAVDRNTNSPYYGRVFVGNAEDHSNGGTSPSYGNYLGIQKLNADGSYADEGGFSDGGVAWNGQTYGPFKIRVSEDDYVYVSDVFNAGDVYRFDETISSNSMLHVFSQAVYSNSWTGLAVVGRGTNTALWSADSYGSMGVTKFPVQPDGTFDLSNALQVVAAGGTNGLNQAPFAVALDNAGAIYALEYITDEGNQGSASVFRFPAYDPSTNNFLPETNADWELPGDTDTGGGHGAAVDPTGKYLAATFRGYSVGSFVNGNIKVLNAADSTIVTNLDLGVAYTNNLTTDPLQHQDTDADWDAVGNLYYLDEWPGCWRAFSPPGANQATTMALAKVLVGVAVVQPDIQSIGVSGGTVTIRFTAGPADTASMFTLVSAGNVNGTYLSTTGAIITLLAPGSFQATAPAPSAAQFYRIRR